MPHLQTTTEVFGNVDRRWLASRFGTDLNRTVTLDLALFTAATHYPDGTIKSGTAIGKVTATGLYGPYSAAAVDGRQTMTGLLFNDVRVTDGTRKDFQPMYWNGIVREARLPTNSGIDAAGKANVAAHIRFE